MDESNTAAGDIQGSKKPDNGTCHAGNVETTLLEHTPNTPTVTKAESATALKSVTVTMSKLSSQCTPVGDHETSSSIEGKETAIDTKPP